MLILTFPNLRPHPRRHRGMLPGITAGTVLRALHRAGREDGEICEAKGWIYKIDINAYLPVWKYE